MQIQVDGKEYSVSMTWQSNEIARFFVRIDGVLHELDLKLSREVNDFETHITPEEVRHILAREIKQKTNDRLGDRGQNIL